MQFFDKPFLLVISLTAMYSADNLKVILKVLLAENI